MSKGLDRELDRISEKDTPEPTPEGAGRSSQWTGGSGGKLTTTARALIDLAEVDDIAEGEGMGTPPGIESDEDVCARSEESAPVSGSLYTVDVEVDNQSI